MDANLWNCVEGGKLEFSSSKTTAQAVSSAPSSFLFQLPGAEAPKPKEDNSPKDQIKLVDGLDISVMCSHPLTCFTQTYFEVTIVALPPESVVAIGLAISTKPKSLPGWIKGSVGFHSDDGKLYLESGEDGQTGKGLTKFGVGDVVGCGLTQYGKIFFTQNGKACSPKYQHKLPLFKLHPVIGLDGKGVTVKINMQAANPRGAYNADKLPWAPLIGNPLGQVAIGAPFKQDSKFLSLPPDVIKILISYEVGSVLLELCRAVYQKISPMFKWIDVHEAYEKGPGFYRDTEHQVSEEVSEYSYTFGFELLRGGTYKGRYRTLFSDETVKGTWSLQYKPKRQVVSWELVSKTTKNEKVTILVFNPKPPKKSSSATRHPSEMEFDKVVGKMKTSEDGAFKFLPEPTYRPMRKCGMRKCGVPLEQQLTNVDCCFEIVEEIVNSVWDSHYDHLGCDVKKSISQRVSRRCMTPPGMTDDEIRIAIAQEIANCDEWNCAFEQVS